MFKLEKEMIPILRTHLSKVYHTQHFINEFDSGNGIADLVFTTEEIDITRIPLINYDSIYFIYKYLSEKNKKIEITSLSKNNILKKKQLSSLIDFLIHEGVLEKPNNNEIIVKKKYIPPIRNIISIEAKLSDWKGGFYQALRYKTYSHKSYLAISKEFAHRVDIDLLKQNNIGLIIVSPNKIHIALQTRKEIPSNEIAYAYLAERMTQTLFA